MLKLTGFRSPELMIGQVREELLIGLEIYSLNKEGLWNVQSYHILFDTQGVGRFPSTEQCVSSAQLTLLTIDVDALGLTIYD